MLAVSVQYLFIMLIFFFVVKAEDGICFFFFKQETAYEVSACLVGSECV